MRHRAAPPGIHRQARLALVQCLDWSLLIHAEEQGLIRQVHIQAHHVRQPLQELQITRQLKGPDSVRLQTVRLPDALDHGGADTVLLGNRAATPMRRPFGWVCTVAAVICCTIFHEIEAGVLGPCALPSTRAGSAWAKCSRHRMTVGRLTPNRLAIWLVIGQPLGYHQNDAAPHHDAQRSGSGFEPIVATYRLVSGVWAFVERCPTCTNLCTTVLISSSYI